jgi:hypothetical protein
VPLVTRGTLSEAVWDAEIRVWIVKVLTDSDHTAEIVLHMPKPIFDTIKISILETDQYWEAIIKN